MTGVEATETSAERFFFCHMQKTGGVSLWMRMQRQFEPHEVYPNDTDGDPLEAAPQMMVPVLLERWAARREDIRLIGGHFPLCTSELLDAEFRTFTVLRDPVERTLSYLRHSRATEPGTFTVVRDPDGGTVSYHDRAGERDHRESSLEEIYEEPWWFLHFIRDHMVKMLSLRAEEMDSFGLMTIVETDEGDLARAKEALGRLDTFGLQDDLEGFGQQLEARYGWDLGPPVRANTSAPVKVPDSFRRRIAEDNRLDMELYEHARELLGR